MECGDSKTPGILVIVDIYFHSTFDEEKLPLSSVKTDGWMLCALTWSCFSVNAANRFVNESSTVTK